MSVAPPTTALNAIGYIGEGAKPQKAFVIDVFSGVTGAGTSGPINLQGIGGQIYLEAYNSGSASISFNVQHTMDAWDVATSSSPWEDEGMEAIGSAGARSIVVGAQSVGSATVAGYQLVDNYPTIQIVTSSASSGCDLQIRLYVIPVGT